jgi:hypothetical protein
MLISPSVCGLTDVPLSQAQNATTLAVALLWASGSLARVLQLDDDQRSYLSELAGKDTARPRRRARQTVHAVAATPARRPAVHPGGRPGPPDGNPGVERAGRVPGDRLRADPREKTQLQYR